MEKHDRHSKMKSTTIDRRTFLKLLGLSAGGAILPGALMSCAPAPAPTSAPTVEGTAAASPTAMATQVVAGELLPELRCTYNTSDPWLADAWRKWKADLESVGFRIRLDPLSNQEWIDVMIQHVFGDMSTGQKGARPERIDPNDLLYAQCHSKEAPIGFRNFGEFICQDFDDLYDAQAREVDREARMDLVWQATQVVYDNYYTLPIGHPDDIHAYNSEEWEGARPTLGNGAFGWYFPWTYLNLRSKTGKSRLTVGRLSGVTSTNVIGPGAAWRGEGKFIYDRLAQMDQNLQPIPWAAESWENVDDVTWDVTLREGMKYHDGVPVTAEDLKWTFDYWLEYKPGLMSIAFDPVESVEVVGDRTVRFVTKEPYGSFVDSLLVVSYCMPPHLWDGLLEEQGVEDPRELIIDNPVGSGFFKFVHYIKDQELLLEANKEHWAAPSYDELLVPVIPTLDGILGQLETKELDASSENLTPTQAEELAKLPHISIERTPSYATHYLVALQRYDAVPYMPFADIVVRKAIFHSIDREFVVDVLWEGAGSIGSDPIFGPAHPFHNPDIDPVPFDVDAARSFLAEAGYTWDENGQLHYPPEDNANFKERIEKVTLC